MIYGYARASYAGPSAAAQVAQLKAAGAVSVFRDSASASGLSRNGLRRALNQLESGDVLLVTQLNRLALSTRELLSTLAAITGKQAGFRSLAENWADTTTRNGRFMLTVLGGLAEFERESNRARTTDGQQRAVARGVKLGRKPKLTPQQTREAIRRRDRGELLRDIARSYNVSHSTISRLAL